MGNRAELEVQFMKIHWIALEFIENNSTINSGTPLELCKGEEHDQCSSLHPHHPPEQAELMLSSFP